MNYTINIDDVEKLEGNDIDVFRAYYTDTAETYLKNVPTEVVKALRKHKNVLFVHPDMMDTMDRFLDKSFIRTFLIDEVLEEIDNIEKEGYGVLVYSFYYAYKTHVKIIIGQQEYFKPWFRKCIISDALDNV